MTPICLRRVSSSELPPTFDHLAVFEFGDLHAADFDLLASGRDFSEGTGVRASEGSYLRTLICRPKIPASGGG